MEAGVSNKYPKLASAAHMESTDEEDIVAPSAPQVSGHTELMT